MVKKVSYLAPNELVLFYFLIFVIFYSNAEHVVNVASNILTSYKQRNPNENSQQSPIVLNCLTGCADRSGIVTLGICAILASQMKKPILLSKKLIHL